MVVHRSPRAPLGKSPPRPIPQIKRSRSRNNNRSRSRSRGGGKRSRSKEKSYGRSGRRSAVKTRVPSRDRYTSDLYYLGGLAKASGMALPDLTKKYWQFRERYPNASFRTIAQHLVGDAVDVATLGAQLGWYGFSSAVSGVKATGDAVVWGAQRARSKARRARSSLKRAGSSLTRAGSSLKRWWNADPKRSRSRHRNRSRGRLSRHR
jgi:hypothetical protein